MDATRQPTLREILFNDSPPPWALRAFHAHLSQHHCEETLQFNRDAENYAVFYNQLVGESPTQRDRRVISSWQKLVRLYIAPCGPRQINISNRERDHILNLPCGPPPHPSELDESRKVIYGLMNDSLLDPFFDLVNPMQRESQLGQQSPLPPDVHTQPSISRDAPQVASCRHAMTFEGRLDESRVDDGRTDGSNKERHRSESNQHTPSRCLRHIIALCKKYWERIRKRAMLCL